mmetsp:Transcript_43702/g.103167  ORF Transcript_43702/g.103167 Transcript_43702/m.103167 type:complete len:607 (-) Transcript_43702:196-2016(-)
MSTPVLVPMSNTTGGQAGRRPILAASAYAKQAQFGAMLPVMTPGYARGVAYPVNDDLDAKGYYGHQRPLLLVRQPLGVQAGSFGRGFADESDMKDDDRVHVVTAPQLYAKSSSHRIGLQDDQARSSSKCSRATASTPSLISSPAPLSPLSTPPTPQNLAAVRSAWPQPGLPRSMQRVLIIECGFGRLMNPWQAHVVQEAGFDVRWAEGLPNPEMDGVDVMSYMPFLLQRIEEVQPHVLICASKGAPYMIAAWETGVWQGASVMINRHPTLRELPQDVRVVLCQGCRDEIYPVQSRRELEDLVRSGSPNQTMLYYTADGGSSALGGPVCRQGDYHNQESLLHYECLPRLIDAALAVHEAPDLHFMRSWVSLALTPERLRAERFLGYTPEEITTHWTSAGPEEAEGGLLFEVHPGSSEYEAVHTLFRSSPKVRPAYDSPLRGTWARSRILRIERVESTPQILDGALPYARGLEDSLGAQGIKFEPGVHTRWAFHGSACIDAIVHDPAGFRVSPSGRTVWGLGTYFARDAQYCCDGGFCPVTPDGTRKVLLSLLSIGMPCVGDPSYQGQLPIRQDGQPFDSAVDCLSNPEVHITHMRGAAYPAYVITFA